MLQKITILLFSVLSGVHSEESNQPSSVLAPRDFNHHAYVTPVAQSRLTKPKPTEKGPVLFPNDGPPQPETPLVVTSRPLSEQLARYLSKEAKHNNSLASPSYLSPKYEPNYLARFNTYKPFSQSFSTRSSIPVNPVTGTPLYPVDDFDGFSRKSVDDDKDFYDYPGKNFDNYSGNNGQEYNHPYADIVKKSRILDDGFNRDNRYNDYEERTILPPIYKALSDHAKQNVLRTKGKKEDYQVKEHDYSNQYDNDVDKYHHDDNEGLQQNQNYAFSYTVKDHHTGDDFSHSQRSTGSSTNGEYRVRLPDGRMQIVSYTADENGYKADVRYDDARTDEAGNGIEYTGNGVKYTGSGAKYTGNEIGNTGSYHVIGNDSPYGSRNRYNGNTDSSSNDYKNYFDGDYNRFDEHKPDFGYDTNVNSNTKLGVIVVPNSDKNTISTVKPSYEHLKPLFVTKNYNRASTVKPSYEQLKPLFVTKNFNTASTIKPSYEQSKPHFVTKNRGTISTLKPSYDELKPLFVTRKPAISSAHHYSEIPLEINTPSTTPTPFVFQTPSTERIVLIGGSRPPLYSGIGNLANSLKIPTTTAKYSYSPQPAVRILPSVGPSLVKNVNLSTESKAILSDSFINRINKYLSFK